MICQNTLIQWLSTSDAENPPVIERVLKIHPEEDIAVTIEMKGENGMPETKSLLGIHQAIESGEAEIMNCDPWHASLEEPSDKDRETRDRNWQIIQPIIELPELRDRIARGAAIKHQTTAYHIPPLTLYRLLRKYWRCGQTINALIPRFQNCGAKGVSRIGKGKKAGPKPKLPEAEGKPLTAHDITIIKRAATKFYVKETKPTLTLAYQKMRAEYYNIGHRTINGVKIPILAPPNATPSERQFEYHSRDIINKLASKVRREGQRKFDQRLKELDGRFRTDCPGGLWMIDPTPADIYLTTTYDLGQTAKRATLYLMVDHCTRMIVGFYFGFGNACAKAAGLTLANAARDKVEFCADYGIEISEEEWPCQHLPSAVLADQGELRGPIAEPWIDQLGIDIHSAPTDTPQSKGAVERCLGLLQNDLFPGLPGHIRKDHARRDADPRTEARFTLFESTQLIIRWILAYNKTPVKSFIHDALPQEAGLSPIKRWKWAVQNRGGELRTIPQKNLIAATHPRGEVTIQRDGIHFKRVVYDCQSAYEQRWGVAHVGKKLKCYYDELNAATLWISHEDGRLERCEIKHQNDIAWGKSQFEMALIRQSQRKDIHNDMEDVHQMKADLRANVDAILATKAQGKRRIKNLAAATEMEKALTGGTQALPDTLEPTASQYIPRLPEHTTTVSAQEPEEEEDEDLELLKSMTEAQ